jgi:hypothetical protein
MDLQILYNNPKPGKSKESSMYKKKKKNPTQMVYVRGQAADIGEKSLKKRGYKPSRTIGKVKFFTAKETEAIEKDLGDAIKKVESGSDTMPGTEKLLKQLKKKKELYEKKLKSQKDRLAKEIEKMKEKDYQPEEGISPKQAMRKNISEKNQIISSVRKVDNQFKRLVKSVKNKIKKTDKKLKSDKKASKKKKDSKKTRPKRRGMSAKKLSSKVKGLAKYAQKARVKKYLANKAGASEIRKELKKVSRVRKLKNPIKILDNPSIEILSNPKKGSKKVSKKKKSSKKTSKKKSSKKASPKKAVKKSKASPKKKVSKKKSSKKKSKKSIKAISSHPYAMKASKKTKKKKNPSYKKKSNPQSIKETIMVTGKKVGEFVLAGHKVLEATGLVIGGASIPAISAGIDKYAPVIRSFIGKTPILSNIANAAGDAFLPAVIGMIVHQFVPNDKAKAVAKGIVGAAVVSISYKLTSEAMGLTKGMAGFVTSPDMQGIVAVPEMNGFAGADFGSAYTTQSSDFGSFVAGDQTPLEQPVDYTSEASMGSYGAYDFEDNSEEVDF